jgi:predicted transcriptional regulator
MSIDEPASNARTPSPEPDRIFAAQIRAARALLDWSQQDLVEQSGVSRPVIQRLERGITDARGSTTRAIRDAFFRRGVEFVTDADGRPGLFWRP